MASGKVRIQVLVSADVAKAFYEYVVRRHGKIKRGAVSGEVERALRLLLESEGTEVPAPETPTTAEVGQAEEPGDGVERMNLVEYAEFLLGSYPRSLPEGSVEKLLDLITTSCRSRREVTLKQVAEAFRSALSLLEYDALQWASGELKSVNCEEWLGLVGEPRTG